MKKNLLFCLSSVLAFSLTFAQADKNWKAVEKSIDVKRAKATTRESFPTDFQLFELNFQNLQNSLVNAPKRLSNIKKGIIVSLPNTLGTIERFEVFEFSNFDDELQAQFPEIRSYAGVGLDDKNATVRFSVAPNSVQTMVFRADKSNEFMEPYSEDGKIYAVFNSARIKGRNGFACYTDDQSLIQTADQIAAGKNAMRSNTGQLKTMRLALSCTAEYSNYFLATSPAQVSLVLAAFNASLTRCNGVYEKDLALHLNIIAQSTNVIYYNAATDPYSAAATGAAGAWNAELQNTLSANLTGVGTSLAANNAVYDIGHLFGASGGGGNAGCIGCVCVDDTASTTDQNKGSGYTSPADGVPSGDTFDIDYVTHEMGHQLGGNHTFSHTTENNPVNVEPGSGSTIMGYAGITGATDVQQNSDDYYVYASILQIQTNLAGKTCPVITSTSNQAPVMNAGGNFTIPKGTPFKLTGSGTDPNGNAINYCWEQNDDATTVGAASSYPVGTKTNGPNFKSFDPVSVPYRWFPSLTTVLGNSLSNSWEATSTVGRTLNFVLTGRDNVAGFGQTGYANAVITVSNLIGPFDVTSQAAAGISWTQGTSQTITWLVNGSAALSANVDILLSTDGGLTFPTVLATAIPNNGSATITVPNVAATNCRVMVKSSTNVFYDINPARFAIGYIIATTCNTYSNNTALVVPDGPSPNVAGNVVTNTITVPTSGTISDVNVSLNVNHTWPNDLVIGINHPDATQNLAWNRACGGNDNFNVTLSDGSPTFTCVANMTGTFSPSSPLSVFNNKPSNGTWTLLAADYYNGDTGTINNWSIEVCTETATLVTENFGLNNFSIYPNPNNGAFSIQFDSTSSNDINVLVNDMRGREVYSRAYRNNGLFNENIQLNNLQAGVYLVSVQDGNRKEVKKVIIQ